MLTVLVACAGADPATTPPPTTSTGTDPASAWVDGLVDDLALAHTFRADGDPRPVSVSCTLQGDPAEVHRVAGEAPGELALYGLLAESDYDCVLTDGDRAELRSFATGPLPDELPSYVVTGAVPDGGYTLFNHARSGERLIVVDADGRVRWYHEVPYDSVRADLDASWLGEGRVLYGGAFRVPPTVIDLAGTALLEGPAAGLDGVWHHHVEALPSGEVVALAVSPDALGADGWDGATVELLDPALATSTVLWDTQQGVDDAWLPVPPVTLDDPYHVNAVVLTADRLYVNFRELSVLAALDRATGELLWQLGPHVGGFALLDAAGARAGPEDWFYAAHAPKLDGDRVLLYDNGTGRPGGESSRVVELRLDEVTRTARVLWEWTEPGWYEVAYGDVDRLPDGQVLITRAHCSDCQGTGDGRTALVQLDPSTLAVVWRLEMFDARDAGYRAERIDRCGIFANAKYCPDQE